MGAGNHWSVKVNFQVILGTPQKSGSREEKQQVLQQCGVLGFFPSATVSIPGQESACLDGPMFAGWIQKVKQVQMLGMLRRVAGMTCHKVLATLQSKEYSESNSKLGEERGNWGARGSSDLVTGGVRIWNQCVWFQNLYSFCSNPPSLWVTYLCVTLWVTLSYKDKSPLFWHGTSGFYLHGNSWWEAPGNHLYIVKEAGCFHFRGHLCFHFIPHFLTSTVFYILLTSSK